MYFVKYGKQYLHDPRITNCALFDLSLTAEENSCGYCDFTIYPDHPMYDKLKERDANNPIEVYDGYVLLFAGFIYELGKEFYLNGTVKCKGELDYLSDTIIRPYSTLQRGYGLKAPTKLDEYFEWLIEQHNIQADSNKQFTVGINQGAALDENNYIFRENDQYPTTISELSEKLLKNENAGGFLNIRHENGVRYIDYLSEWTESNSQIFDFGVNLTDYTQTDDSEDIATFVVPLGARISETEYSYNDGYFVTSDTTVDTTKTYYTKSDEYYSECYNLTSFETGVTYYEYNEYNDETNLLLTIDGLDDGRYEEGYVKLGDMIYCEEAVKKYGWIGIKYENQDITEKKNLVDKGIIALKEYISPKRTIEIKAVDMHLLNPDMKPIKVGEYVRVRSKPHNLDSYFLCTSIDLDLNNPENSLYTLGTSFDTLTGQQNKIINSLNKTITSKTRTTMTITDEDLIQTIADAQEAKAIAYSAVSSVSEEFAVTSSPSEVPTEGWSDTAVATETSSYVWRRMVTTYTDGSTEESSASLVQNGEDAVLLRINSSRGNVFKNNSISTVLSAVIYKGSERITTITKLHEIFGSGSYLQWQWQKMDDDTYGVISSSDSRLGDNGFTLRISPDDVDTKVTFLCQLII